MFIICLDYARIVINLLTVTIQTFELRDLISVIYAPALSAINSLECISQIARDHHSVDLPHTRRLTEQDVISSPAILP